MGGGVSVRIYGHLSWNHYSFTLRRPHSRGVYPPEDTHKHSLRSRCEPHRLFDLGQIFGDDLTVVGFTFK